MQLDDVVPWGRSFDEYRAMFALGPDELATRVLDCGGGPASFNAEATELGARVVSMDPLYAFGTEKIERRVRETFDVIVAQTRANAGNYVWERFPDVEALGAARMATMRRFLSDYETGRAADRYVAAALPTLPCVDDAFDLALSSHLLFLYSEHLSAEFHLASMRELLRVAREVRVFPLLTLTGAPSPHLPSVGEALERDGHLVEVRRVGYEFQRGGDSMLRVCRR